MEESNMPADTCAMEESEPDFFSSLDLGGFSMTDERVRPWEKFKRIPNRSRSGKVLVKCSGKYCYGTISLFHIIMLPLLTGCRFESRVRIL